MSKIKRSKEPHSVSNALKYLARKGHIPKSESSISKYTSSSTEYDPEKTYFNLGQFLNLNLENSIEDSIDNEDCRNLWNKIVKKDLEDPEDEYYKEKYGTELTGLGHNVEHMPGKEMREFAEEKGLNRIFNIRRHRCSPKKSIRKSLSKRKKSIRKSLSKRKKSIRKLTSKK